LVETRGGGAVPSRAPDGVADLHGEIAAQEIALGVRTDGGTEAGVWKALVE